MQQHRLTMIRNLLALRSLALQIPKYPKIIDASKMQSQQMPSLTFHRYLTQATTTKTKSDEQKANRQQQKITLISPNQSISITTLDEAQKLAKRRDLHLLRLQQPDAKTGRIMFKLVTTAEMLADESEGKGAAKSTTGDKGNKKSEKSLTIGARITDHDLASRLKNITKWLNKRHEVRILIQGNASGADEGNAERIVKTIEATIKEPQILGKIVQKRQKGSFIKFSIMPVAAAVEAGTTTTTPPLSPPLATVKQS
ncbi:translation initiation factor IF-3 [Drosophila virilis]|uniref:Translation initiation factor 3 N-terminal domain-containing protein n=1 Tax=Drosophila virilis TaxID=7244 RepID=B4LJQ7_DROVI|nr:translation initiation factor IF-3, mitochondrial [Drosophila virilis]EDW60566.2 uncharacterized protein Dvir_GJ20787 [Drosophila virilis]